MSESDAHAPLRQDVRLLGQLLGDTLQEQESPVLLELVEEIRRLAKDARSGREDNSQKLFEKLSRLEPELLVPVARAFSHFLNLSNLAEQYHRVRRRRVYQQAPQKNQRATMAELHPRLKRAGIADHAMFATLQDLSIDLVLTAHPTEVTRRTLIRKYDDITHCLEQLDAVNLTDIERNRVLETLKRKIVSAWNSDEIRQQRPTPVDEARWGFVTIEQTLWHAVPEYLRELDDWCQDNVQRRLPLGFSPFTFSSWMGGDRDGNPNVTADVTREVLTLARWMAADLLSQDFENLHMELSMVDCNAALREQVGDSREPYRALIKPLRDRLFATKGYLTAVLDGKEWQGEAPVLQAAELMEALKLCHQSLVECGMPEIAEGELLDTIRRLNTFGMTLVRLDIRQESTRHADAMTAITQAIGLGDYSSWTETEKQRFLIQELTSERPLIPRHLKCDGEVREVLDTFYMLAEQSIDALGAYVISMAHSPSDVLAVLLLQKEADMDQPMRVVPLFETLDDLHHARDTLQRLLEIDWYREHINGHQEIMIGYSDSAKDGGFLAAAWVQYQAQEQLTALCREYAVRLTLFHGRGGSTSRGGAPSHEAILSQPPGAVNGRIRITEQGEVIRAKFSPFGVAIRTLQRYVAATLEATLIERPAPDPQWREAMDQLAAVGSKAYRSTLWEDPRFLTYFRHATPEQELQRLPLGSRPAKRKQGGIESLRAIPWVFAWTQMRLMLPGWLGCDTAFQTALQDGKGTLLHEMYERWPFFRMIIGMLEMLLAKSDPQIAAYYERRLAQAEDRKLGQELRTRLAEMVDLVNAITGHSLLLQNNAVIRRSIEVRNPYLDPLHVLQVELMRAARLKQEERPEQTRALMITVAGIAAGMRNTG
ncbi:MAG: phosphoenolpyruvate carboxylase [Pseudomonadales bacterium]|nr:phosphoenolpyruvate carboxylase [Pseudomonadales bacterium]